MYRDIRKKGVLFAAGWMLAFAATAYAVVGPIVGTTGSSPRGNTAREDITGAQVTTNAHSKYFEASSRGVMMGACDQANGVAVPTSVSTTAILSLYNPKNSGKLLVITKRQMTYFSGTLGTGVVYDCINNNPNQTAPSSGTTLTTQATNGGAPGVGIAGTGTTVVSPVAIGILAYLAPELATTVSGPQTSDVDLDGLIVVQPGCTYQMQSVAAAGSSPKVTVAIFWEEVPYVP